MSCAQCLPWDLTALPHGHGLCFIVHALPYLIPVLLWVSIAQWPMTKLWGLSTLNLPYLAACGQVTFKDIIAHYRRQPQAKNDIFRSVPIRLTYPDLQVEPSKAGWSLTVIDYMCQLLAAWAELPRHPMLRN